MSTDLRCRISTRLLRLFAVSYGFKVVHVNWATDADCLDGKALREYLVQRVGAPAGLRRTLTWQGRSIARNISKTTKYGREMDLSIVQPAPDQFLLCRRSSSEVQLDHFLHPRPYKRCPTSTPTACNPQLLPPQSGTLIRALARGPGERSKFPTLRLLRDAGRYGNETERMRWRVQKMGASRRTGWDFIRRGV